MDERVIQFRVGVVVIAAICITVILVGLFGLGFRRQYTLSMQVAQAPGVSVDTPVRKNGVLIGRVSSVDLLDEGGVLLTLKIDAERKIRKGEIPVISTASLFGDAIIEFVPSQKDDPALFEDGEVITTGVVRRSPLEALELAVELEDQIRDTLSSVEQAGDAVRKISETFTAQDGQEMRGNLSSAMRRFESAATEIESTAAEVKQAANNFNRVITTNERDVETLLDNANLAVNDFRRTMASVDSFFTNVDEFVSDPELRAELKRAIAALPPLIDEAARTMQTAQATLRSFEQVSASAARNLQNLEGLTRPLGENGPELVEALRSAIGNLDLALAETNRFVGALGRGEGTVGKLLYDEELAVKITQTVDNIEDVSRRLRPIMEDVRIFTDKIARDPRQLGVKGALDQTPSGQGSKHGLPTEPSMGGGIFHQEGFYR